MNYGYVVLPLSSLEMLPQSILISELADGR